jgi:hypothetical protein
MDRKYTVFITTLSKELGMVLLLYSHHFSRALLHLFCLCMNNLSQTVLNVVFFFKRILRKYSDTCFVELLHISDEIPVFQTVKCVFLCSASWQDDPMSPTLSMLVMNTLNRVLVQTIELEILENW